MENAELLNVDDIVVGDVITYSEAIWQRGAWRSGRRFLGQRSLTVEVLSESYSQQNHRHFCRCKVLESSGYQPLEPGVIINRMAKTLYAGHPRRLVWDDERLRDSIAAEKHRRGDYHRQQRAVECGR